MQNAFEELLELFNISFQEADLPSEWHNAVIIPLLKADKSASYRLVSFIFCVVKHLERILADRHFHWFSKFQARFRKGRSCDDQILRVLQKIDGFQKKLTHRLVMVLLDFSKAYDTEWREKLLDAPESDSTTPYYQAG